MELRPPQDSGFSGTAKFDAEADAAVIRELVERRGYTLVEAAE